MNTVQEKSLRQPVKVEIDPDLIFEATTFRQYARYMMYPDPTYIVLSTDTANIITDAVNNGLDIWEVFRTLHSDYHYDDWGREYISFPDPDRAQNMLSQLISQNENEQRQEQIML